MDKETRRTLNDARRMDRRYGNSGAEADVLAAIDSVGHVADDTRDARRANKLARREARRRDNDAKAAEIAKEAENATDAEIEAVQAALDLPDPVYGVDKAIDTVTRAAFRAGNYKIRIRRDVVRALVTQEVYGG